MEKKFTRKESLSLLKKLEVEVSAHALVYQAQEGGLTEVKHLINVGIDVNSIFEGHDNTALINSSREGRTDVVKFLLKEGANASVLNNKKCDALYYAVIGGHVEVAKCLLESGANPDGTLGIALSPISGAIETGNKELIKLLLDFKADLSIKSDNKFIPLIRASRKGLIDVVKLLLEKGANANVLDNEKCDALYYSVLGGHVEVSKYLLESGANPDGTPGRAFPPIGAALEIENKELIKLLVDHKVDLDIKSDDGYSLAYSCYHHCSKETYDYLISLGATPLSEEELKKESFFEKLLNILKTIYAKDAYLFIGVQAFCIIIIFFVLNEKTGGGFFSRVFMFVFCVLMGGVLGMWFSRKSKEIEFAKKGFRRGANILLVFATLITWSNNNYTPSHSSSSSSSSSQNHTCSQCGASYSGNGWSTAGGEQFMYEKDPGYDACCSKSCAYDSQPSNWK